MSGNGKPSWADVKLVGAILRDLGFSINEKKIKFMFKNNEQKVLGVTVNDKVSINHRYRKDLKMKIKSDQLTTVERGRLAYVKSINEEQYNKLIL